LIALEASLIHVPRTFTSRLFADWGYLLRDPVTRLLSHYAHTVVDGKKTRDLSTALSEPDNPYLSLSRYAT
jgi:hypothetical protein